MSEVEDPKKILNAQIKKRVLEKRIEQAARDVVKNDKPAPQLIIRKATDVPDERLRHIFGGRLLYGAFQLMVGAGEAGKGMVSVDTISRLSSGAPFPGEGKDWRRPANCIICVTEDSAPRVKARLSAAEANLDHIFFLDGPPAMRGGLIVPSPIAFDDDAGALLKVIKDMGAGALFLETTLEHLGGRDDNKSWSTNNEMEVRRALAPIVTLCRESGIIGWGVMHPRKSVDGGIENSISGSAAFNNVARGVLHVARDPADDNASPARLIFSNKSNYLRMRPKTLMFHIEPWEKNPEEGKVVWGIEGRTLEDQRTAEDIWDQIREKHKRQGPRRDAGVVEAEEFLRKSIKEGISFLELKKRAKDEDISWSSIKRAKHNLRIISIKEGMPATVVRWEFEREEM